MYLQERFYLAKLNKLKGRRITLKQKKATSFAILEKGKNADFSLVSP